MNINLIKDTNCYLTVNDKSDNTDYTKIKTYTTIDWYIDNTSLEDNWIKISLLDEYDLNNLTLVFDTYDFVRYDVYISNDNINYEKIQSNITPTSSQMLTFNEKVVKFIKIIFIDVNELKLTSITSTVNVEYNNTKLFQKYSISNLKNLLPTKYKNSDIEYFYQEYLNKMCGVNNE